jgi:hypothetical protein
MDSGPRHIAFGRGSYQFRSVLCLVKLGFISALHVCSSVRSGRAFGSRPVAFAGFGVVNSADAGQVDERYPHTIMLI